MYNLQAIFGVNPPAICGWIGNNRYQNFTAYRKRTSGRYDIYANGIVRAQLAAVPGVQPKRDTYNLDEVFVLMKAFGAEVNTDTYREHPEWLEFLQRQFDVRTGRTPDGDALAAYAAFEKQVDDLLIPLQQTVLPDYKVATVLNPLKARALHKSKQGLFIWPDWREEGYINVVINVKAQHFRATRTMLGDWVERHKLRLNPSSGF